MFKLRLCSVLALVVTVCGLNSSQPTILTSAQLSGTDARKEISDPSEQVELKSMAVSCSVVLQDSIYTAGEPIVAKLLINNGTTQTIKVNLGFDRQGAFLIQIRRPDGSIFRAPQPATRNGLSPIPTFAIKPQAMYSQQLLLNNWDSFASVGLYEVTVALDESIVGSNPLCGRTQLFLEIQPLNIVRLGEISEELVDSIANGSNYAIASDAARVLTAIKNPIVVTYLKRAHQANPRVDDILIDGLESIADREAVEVLISILNDADKKSASFSQAWSALRRIEKKGGDHESSRLIKIALHKCGL